MDKCQQPRAESKNERVKSLSRSPKLLAPPPPTPSRPVIIPTRSRNELRKKNRESVSRDKEQDIQIIHDTSSTPSPTATSLTLPVSPDSRSYTQTGPRFRQTSSASRRISNARLREIPQPAVSSSSPQSWSLLLKPPEELELESSSFDSDTTLGPSSSFRSRSFDSMPSLDTDNESLSSTSNPATPDFMAGTRSSSDRRQKGISTSVGQDCALDHPLLSPAPKKPLENMSESESLEFPTSRNPPPATSRFSLKSNLTASFRKIRSAAQSFSAFTAPPTHQQDYLARTLLSMDSQFSDERRPLPSIDPPDPALRRYLNPATFSPRELHFHSEESTSPRCTASIQLQTYQRRNRSFDKASSPPVFTSAQQKALDAIDGVPEVSSPRQREPRENSNFLRVIVLEMNMRKVGKLSDASPGRAKLWLPARQPAKAVETPAEGGRIPARLAALQA